MHLFWAEEKDKYRYGHVMVPQNRPYQIQELSENGTLKFVWIFPLLLADFKCEISKDHKSFIRKSTNQNYTEPHHLIPMAYSDKFKVSLDVEANIVSLCSTCHNHIHYGVDAKDLLTALYYQRIKRLRAVGLDISLEELLQMYDIK